MQVKAIKRNGPKGIIFSLSLYKRNKEIGKAIKLPKKMENVPSKGSRMSPKTKSILTSPPPRLSFLNTFSPKTIIKYISPKRNMPLKT